MTRRATRGVAPPERPLWTCPACGHRFVSARLWHSCGRYTFEALFARSEPHVRRIFDRLARVARRCGPVHIYPQKTRVVIQARIRFAGGHPQRSRFMASFILPEGTVSHRFCREERFGSSRLFGGWVPLGKETEVDAEIRRLMKLAYRVGCQEHLKD